MNIRETWKEHLYRRRGWWVFLWALCMMYPRPENPGIVFWVLLLVAALLRVRTRMVLGDHSREQVLQAPVLVTEGPYRWCAHPLYLSNVLMGGALALVSGWSWPIKMLGFMVLAGFYVALAIRENVYLAGRYGKLWENWRRGRLERCPLPSKVNMAKAWWSDRWTWFWLSVVLCVIWARA